jgi:hypothetical protein
MPVKETHSLLHIPTCVDLRNSSAAETHQAAGLAFTRGWTLQMEQSLINPVVNYQYWGRVEKNSILKTLVRSRASNYRRLDWRVERFNLTNMSSHLVSQVPIMPINVWYNIRLQAFFRLFRAQLNQWQKGTQIQTPRIIQNHKTINSRQGKCNVMKQPNIFKVLR